MVTEVALNSTNIITCFPYLVPSRSGSPSPHLLCTAVQEAWVELDSVPVEGMRPMQAPSLILLLLLNRIASGSLAMGPLSGGFSYP